jgi:hypothetical protein
MQGYWLLKWMVHIVTTWLERVNPLWNVSLGAVNCIVEVAETRTMVIFKVKWFLKWGLPILQVQVYRSMETRFDPAPASAISE